MTSEPISATAEGMPKSTKSDADMADNMRALEGDVCALLNMARIMTDMLEDTLVGYENGAKIYSPPKGGVMTVKLGFEELEKLSFAWNDVVERAWSLRKKYYAAFGEAVL